MAFYLKHLSKRNYIQLNNFVTKTNEIKFLFNNSNKNNNLYSFDFQLNKAYFDNKNTHIANSIDSKESKDECNNNGVCFINDKSINKEFLFKNMKGADVKMQSLTHFSYLDFSKSALENFSYKAYNENSTQVLVNNKDNKENVDFNDNNLNNTGDNKEKDRLINDYGFLVVMNNHYKYSFIYNTEIILKKQLNKTLKSLLTSSNNNSNIIIDNNNIHYQNLINYIFSINYSNYNTAHQLNYIISNIKRLNNNKLNINPSLHTLLFELKSSILSYSNQLNQIKTILETKKSLVDFRINENQILKSNILILLSIIWLITFSLLIYGIYSWDVIEPVTYLTGSCLVLLQVVYFYKTKNKPGVEFYFSKYFKTNLKKKFSNEYGYSTYFNNQLLKEISNVEVVLKEIDCELKEIENKQK